MRRRIVAIGNEVFGLAISVHRLGPLYTLPFRHRGRS